MKLLKRLPVSLLVIALALGLALPALAIDDPAMPVITAQPQDVSIKSNRRIVLSVEAHIPNGDEIGYQWYRGSKMLDGQTGARLEIKLAAPTDSGLYYVVVCNRGDEAFNVTSASANVKVSQTLFQQFLTWLLLFMPIGTIIALPLSYLYAWIIHLIAPLL